MLTRTDTTTTGRALLSVLVAIAAITSMDMTTATTMGITTGTIDRWEIDEPLRVSEGLAA